MPQGREQWYDFHLKSRRSLGGDPGTQWRRDPGGAVPRCEGVRPEVVSPMLAPAVLFIIDAVSRLQDTAVVT